jgi:predicted Zn-dependent peptidase
VVLEERRLRTEDQPDGRAFELLLGLAFQAHPYRVPTIGWRSDIETVPVKACQDFFNTYYAPNNIVIAVAGDFDAADTLARIRRAFGGFEPVAEIPRSPTKEPEQRGERRAVVHFDGRSPILAAAWHAHDGHPDAEALDVAAPVLPRTQLAVHRKLRLRRATARQARTGNCIRGSRLQCTGGDVDEASASWWRSSDADARVPPAELRRQADRGRLARHETANEA